MKVVLWNKMAGSPVFLGRRVGLVPPYETKYVYGSP